MPRILSRVRLTSPLAESARMRSGVRGPVERSHARTRRAHSMPSMKGICTSISTSVNLPSARDTQATGEGGERVSRGESSRAAPPLSSAMWERGSTSGPRQGVAGALGALAAHSGASEAVSALSAASPLDAHTTCLPPPVLRMRSAVSSCMNILSSASSTAPVRGPSVWSTAPVGEPGHEPLRGEPPA